MNSLLIVTSETGLSASVGRLFGGDYFLFHAGSGMGAIERASKTDVDLVVLDSPLPDMERNDLIVRLLRIRPGLPICALVHNMSSEESMEAMRLGAHRLIGKPFEREELEYTVKMAVESYRAGKRPHEASSAARGQLAAPLESAREASMESLGRFARGLVSLRGEDRLVGHTVDALAEIFTANQIAICLSGAREGAYETVAQIGLGERFEAAFALKPDSGLIRWLNASSRIFRRGEAERGRASEEAARELSLLGAEIAVPLPGSDRLLGFIALGPRATGAGWSEGDLRFLATLGSLTGAAIENIRAAGALRAERDSREAILSSLSGAAVVLNDKGNVEYFNPAAERLFQKEAAAVLGGNVQKLGSKIADFAWRVLDGEIAVGPHLIEGPMGQAEFRVAVSLLKESRGAVFVFEGSDAILNKNRERWDDAARKAWLRAADRLSQEIKNPLTAVKTFTQLLPERYEEEEFRTEFQKVVQDEVDSLDDIAGLLLRFSQPPVPHKAEFDLVEFLKRAFKEKEKSLMERSIKIRRVLPKHPVRVRADAGQLEAALERLIDNGADAIESGGEIVVECETVAGGPEHCAGNGAVAMNLPLPGNETYGHHFAAIRITDTGRGLRLKPEEAFLPFCSTKVKGLGLGLPIADALVRNQGGALALRNGMAKGCSAEILIPFNEAL